MPNLTLPGVSTENWGEIYNTAIEVLNAYIAGVENTFNNHNHNNTYASKEHNHETLEALIAGKSDEGHNHDDRYMASNLIAQALDDKADYHHNHSMSDISDLANLTANLSNATPTVVPSGLGITSPSVVLDVAGVSCLHEWVVAYRFNNSLIGYQIKSQATQIQIAKPPADAGAWQNGQATMQITIKQKNLVNGSESLPVNINLEISQYNYIPLASIVQALESSTQFKTDLGTILANMVVLEAWQQQSQ